MKRNVMGQTGTTVLSDDMAQYKLDKKRTVRFQYTKVKCGWICWTCAPFHSRTYGVCGFGTKEMLAKRALSDNLARNYGYIGTMMLSDVDSADTVGQPIRDWSGKEGVPIMGKQSCGKAGQ